MGKTRGRCVNISLCMCVKFSKKRDHNKDYERNEHDL